MRGGQTKQDKREREAGRDELTKKKRMQALEAACEAQGWKYKKAELDGSAALCLTFLEAVAGSSELLAVPKDGGVADLVFRPKLDETDWAQAVPAQLKDFANVVSPPAHGAVRVRADKYLEVVFTSVPVAGMSPETLGDKLSSFSQLYTPFHLPIVCVATRKVPGRLAVTMTSSFPLGAENKEAQATIVASVCEALQAEGLRFQVLPDETGVMMSFVLGSEGSPKAYDSMIRLRGIHPSPSGDGDSWYASLLVRVMPAGSNASKLSDAAKQREGHLLLTLANYGLSVGHFEQDTDDGTVLFNVEVVVESIMTKSMIGSAAAANLRMAMTTIDRYQPAIKAVADGVKATEAIKLAEPDAPEVTIEDAAANADVKADVEAPVSSLAELRESLFATLDAAGPLMPMRGVEMPRRDLADTVMKTTVLAALDKCGIESFQETSEGATGAVTFGVALPPELGGAAAASEDEKDGGGGESEKASRGLCVEVRWTSVTRETGGPMVLFRSFEVGAKQIPAESLATMAEVVTRCNFGLTFGYFDADPVSRLVAFCAVARFSSKDLFPSSSSAAAEAPAAIVLALVDALQCVISTHASYLPALRYLADTPAAQASAKDAMSKVEDESSGAGFDLTAEVASAAAHAIAGDKAKEVD